MTLAFLIYAYFPYGGQQRDFLRVALACTARGHKVVVYTMKWDGPQPEALEVRLLNVKSFRNHMRYERFATQVQKSLRESPVDAVIGFNRMPGLDVYFAADPCFAERALKERAFYYRFTPRYRHFLRFEQAVFGPQSHTEALLLSPLQRQQFAHHYPQSVTRLHDIPPGISRDRQAPDNAAEVRAAFRAEHGLDAGHLAVLQIGSGFVVKGVDRSLRAIASLPAAVRTRVRYFLVGQDKPDRFQRLAARLGVAQQCVFLSGRDDVPRFLLGSDLLLHPAYSESAGYVLLEAVVAGLPVLTTDTCGYAFHILQAGAGEVCESPFSQDDLNGRLLRMLTSPERSLWQRSGIDYGRREDLYSMPESVAAMIEQFAQRRRAQRGAV
jgi:UDP-glucose:(heptosyl)LPS alpha-1,3-glucosyltransferase